ncbi:MAG: efflux RND transporter periplasmic adaptor subunit [Gammaproteobacteria bacterium]|nr:efflux RND transporter periplasmic adaptor subunit [Gammaproteobacteria bacterium]
MTYLLFHQRYVIVVIVALWLWRNGEIIPFAWAAAAGNEVSAAVEVTPARRAAVASTLTAYGTVENSPEAAQALSAQAEGLVLKVYVAPGQAVRKGDLLLELGMTPNAQTELTDAQIGATFLRRELERLKALKTRQLATNAEVLSAEQALAKADATLANVRLRQGGQAIRKMVAGVDGVVDLVSVAQGEVVPPAAPLVRLAKGDRLRVRLGVEGEDLDRLRSGMTVVVSALFAGAKSVRGDIAQIYRRIDPKTRLAEVVVPLPMGPGLVPGAMVRGEVLLEQRSEVLVVPRSAVLWQGDKTYVYVIEQGRAARRPVETGQEQGKEIEIRSGIAAGDAVVSLGNYELTDGMRVRIGTAL